jgi:hypothetical protein
VAYKLYASEPVDGDTFVNLMARYVRVLLSTTNYLSLAEVQVMVSSVGTPSGSASRHRRRKTDVEAGLQAGGEGAAGIDALRWAQDFALNQRYRLQSPRLDSWQSGR